MQDNESVNPQFDKQKLELIYPCQWEYTLIGHNQERIRQAVDEVIPDLAYSLKPANSSRTGKYCSLHLEVTVIDEGMRNGIHLALKEHRDIIMVL